MHTFTHTHTAGCCPRISSQSSDMMTGRYSQTFAPRSIENTFYWKSSIYIEKVGTWWQADILKRFSLPFRVCCNSYREHIQKLGHDDRQIFSNICSTFYREHVLLNVLFNGGARHDGGQARRRTCDLSVFECNPKYDTPSLWELFFPHHVMFTFHCSSFSIRFEFGRPYDGPAPSYEFAQATPTVATVEAEQKNAVYGIFNDPLSPKQTLAPYSFFLVFSCFYYGIVGNILSPKPWIPFNSNPKP